MAADTLQIQYSTYSATFSDFADDNLPRSILGQASLEFSGLGAAYSTGTARTQRRIWSVAAYGTKTQWNALMNIFNTWDADRITGSNIAEVTVIDNLLGENITASGFFTTAPSIAKVAPGNNTIFLISFGITET